MKKIRKFATLLLTAAMLAATSLTALALPSGGYVPTKGTYSYYDSSAKKWVKSETITLSYKSDGRLTKRTYKYDEDYVLTTKYTWSGNRIKKITESEGGGYTSYKYKGNKLVSYTRNYGEKHTYKFKWKKNKGTLKLDGYTETIQFNSKGQLVKETIKYTDGGTYTYTCKYYANGNLKKVTSKGSSESTTRSYNSEGYLKKYTRKSGGKTYTTKYKYKKKNGKIKQITITYSDGYKNKLVFSKWKKVSHVRNCDASGWFSGLLPN